MIFVAALLLAFLTGCGGDGSSEESESDGQRPTISETEDFHPGPPESEDPENPAESEDPAEPEETLAGQVPDELMGA
ncbi:MULTISPECIES: hypothetical protein [unclassified Streptomyces]|uniref:hypothetical protein n=1 Tax=unclassified Streptomyces TaxID=2593676 RepID=UPI002E781C60|nr:MULTISPECIES: hypothetical protein [unclassified Streptomyces]MEE1758602.1 hypothetical protein [Streptomyces sp. SP18BB07]MEE1831103.1 hypothetical protein [Streptomyces sp. SP17KL33]